MQTLVVLSKAKRRQSQFYSSELTWHQNVSCVLDVRPSYISSLYLYRWMSIMKLRAWTCIQSCAHAELQKSDKLLNIWQPRQTRWCQARLRSQSELVVATYLWPLWQFLVPSHEPGVGLGGGDVTSGSWFMRLNIQELEQPGPAVLQWVLHAAAWARLGQTRHAADTSLQPAAGQTILQDKHWHYYSKINVNVHRYIYIQSLILFSKIFFFWGGFSLKNIVPCVSQSQSGPRGLCSSGRLSAGSAVHTACCTRPWEAPGDQREMLFPAISLSLSLSLPCTQNKAPPISRSRMLKVKM